MALSCYFLRKGAAQFLDFFFCQPVIECSGRLRILPLNLLCSSPVLFHEWCLDVPSLARLAPAGLWAVSTSPLFVSCIPLQRLSAADEVQLPGLFSAAFDWTVIYL